MYLFGGYDNEVGLSSEIYEYDIEKYNWRMITPANEDVKPAPRYG